MESCDEDMISRPSSSVVLQVRAVVDAQKGYLRCQGQGLMGSEPRDSCFYLVTCVANSGSGLDAEETTRKEATDFEARGNNCHFKPHSTKYSNPSRYSPPNQDAFRRFSATSPSWRNNGSFSRRLLSTATICGAVPPTWPLKRKRASGVVRDEMRAASPESESMMGM